MTLFVTKAYGNNKMTFFLCRGIFPVFFMVMLVVVVAVYFAYHNKSKVININIY